MGFLNHQQHQELKNLYISGMDLMGANRDFHDQYYSITKGGYITGIIFQQSRLKVCNYLFYNSAVLDPEKKV